MCMSETASHKTLRKDGEREPITLSIPLFWLCEFNEDGWCETGDGASCGDSCTCGKNGVLR